MMEAAPKRRRTGLIVLITAAALVAAGGGTAWGVTAYQNAKVAEEAEALATSVTAAQTEVSDVSGAHARAIEDAQATVATLQPVVDIAQARSNLFPGEALPAFAGAVVSLGELVGQPELSGPDIAEMFSAQNSAERFVELYRAADQAERSSLAAQAEESVNLLRTHADELGKASDELTAAVSAAQRGGIVLAQALPSEAARATEAHAEADEPAKTTVHEAALADAWDEVSDAELGERVSDLQDHFIGYIEAVDKLTQSHQQAVAAREEAERAAAAAAAAQAAPAKPRMCNRVRPGFGGAPMTLQLVPC